VRIRKWLVGGGALLGLGLVWANRTAANLAPADSRRNDSPPPPDPQTAAVNLSPTRAARQPGSPWALANQTVSDWMDDKVPRLGAALAYYAVFSLAPLLVVSLSVAALVFDARRVDAEVRSQLTDLLGRDGAKAVQAMLVAARQPRSGYWAAGIGVIMLIWGASGVFGQLQDALNTIWEVRPKPGRGFLGMVRDRFFSFTLVLGTGFLLLLSLVVSTVLQAAGNWALGMAGGAEWMGVVNLLVSYLVISGLFALIFKFVPDAIIAWRDVWIGAAFTAALFLAGKWAIGLYLGRGGLESSFGAAASFVVILVWIYYSAQILFFGAEFTQAYARMYGSHVIPGPNAEAVTAEARLKQGMAA